MEVARRLHGALQAPDEVVRLDETLKPVPASYRVMGRNRSIGLSRRDRPDVHLREVAYDGGEVQPPHSHPYSSLTLHVRGGIRESQGRDDVESTGLSVTVKPAGVVHTDRYGPGPVSTLQMILTNAFEPVTGGWSSVLERWRWVKGGPAVRAGLAVLDVLRRPAGDDEEIAEAVAGLLDALEAEPDRAVAGTPPAWLDRAVQRLHDEYANGVRVSEVADDAGVHPVHLTRCFRRYRGCTVTEYRHRLRVRAAARQLADADRDIAAIAYAAGFADQSHLTRTFKRETGLTPVEFRRLVADR